MYLSFLFHAAAGSARPFLCVLTLAACLALAGPVLSATNASDASHAVGVKKAQALMEKGRFSETLTVLRPLARGSTVSSDVLFHIGLAAIGASQMPDVPDDRREALLDEAIAALRRMLVDRPDLVRVRLELARAFFLKGKDPLARLRGADALAREHFERVLAGNPPAGVALNVNRFLAQIRARKDWSAGIGVALAPDSNLAARTDEDRILLNTPFGQLPFEWQGDKPRSGIGVAMWASGEYQYPVARDWRIRAGGNLSRREYRSDEYDRMTLAGHLGPRWLVGRYSEASVSGERASELAVGRGGVPRSRGPGGGASPARRADRGEPRGLAPRAALRGCGPSGRAADRRLARAGLGGVPDGADRHGGGMEPAADGTQAPAQFVALAPAGGLGAAAARLHGGRGGGRCAGPPTGATGRLTFWAADRGAT